MLARSRGPISERLKLSTLRVSGPRRWPNIVSCFRVQISTILTIRHTAGKKILIERINESKFLKPKYVILIGRKALRAYRMSLIKIAPYPPHPYREIHRITGPLFPSFVSCERAPKHAVRRLRHQREGVRRESLL